ncbi:MAG: cupin domain-containing protein [Methanosarcinaceae archaeon]
MKQSLFDNIHSDQPDEVFETLCSSDTVKIERIISRGHSSPEGFWYDQTKNEFVLVVQGSARVSIQGEENSIIVATGEYLNIRAHVKHRVEWTDPDINTIWLAVHY